MSKEQLVADIYNACFGVSTYSHLDAEKFILFAEALTKSGLGISEAAEFFRRNEALRTTDKGAYVVNCERVILRALCIMCETIGSMDSAVDYALADRAILNYEFIKQAYYGANRCLMRRLDLSFRSAEELGLKKGGKKTVANLVTCAIRHRDPECIDILRTYPVAQEILTEEYIEKVIRDHKGSRDYEEVLRCFDRFVPKVEVQDMKLQAYWEMLEENKAFDFGTPKDTILRLYNRSLIQKCPDGFVSKILNLGRSNVDNGNYLIVLMQEDGVDCYPGYVLGLEGTLAAYDKHHGPRDYETMIDVCLKRKPLPGFIGLMCGIPMEEIMRHKRSKEVLSLIHELTGSRIAIEQMNRKQRGKALMIDLAL